MDHLFAPNDHVEFDTGILGVPKGRGRVVSWMKPGGSSDPRLAFYTVLLDKPVAGFNWPAITLISGQLRKLSILESMAVAAEAPCVSCGRP